MSAPDPDRLVRLLPTIHRLRDAQAGGTLAALLRVVGEQVQVLDDDIEQLYDNWFIETCDAWAVPYLGDLIGAAPGASRREVAGAIGARRRKGTLALLEELAREVAGWPARAVELRELLALSQSVKRPQLERGHTLDLRDGAALAALDGPFDTAAHTVSVPRLTSGLRRTRYGIPDVAVFAWRLLPHTLTRTPAYCLDRSPSRFTFSTLTNDVPLMTRPIAEPDPTHVADELNVPGWISRRALADRTADVYGQSFVIYEGAPDRPVALSRIVAADLSDWSYEPPGREVAVDTVRGRIAFSPDHAPEHGVWVDYVTGFSAEIGGGEYPRTLSPTAGRPVYTVGRGAQHRKIGAAIEAWAQERAHDPSKRSAIVEIRDSGLYEDDGIAHLRLRAGDRLELRAAVGARPHIRITDRRGARLDALRIEGQAPENDGDAAPQVVLDGLLISGRAVRVSGWIGCLQIRHCTLVPGWSLEYDCEPRAQEPSLIIDRPRARPRVTIEHSIVGGIRVEAADEVLTDPFAIRVSDSILDATAPTAAALAGRGDRLAHAELTVVRSTVLGQLRVHALALGEDSILAGVVRVARRQIGCLRFCAVAGGSRTPRRFACTGLRPQFVSTRYGRPDYARLSPGCPDEIARGAHDESELGAFHDLQLPQRTAALEARLQEFTPAGSSAGIIFAT